ncbi:hypothetical protein QUB17_21940 [Microcoleus sp. B5-C4]
MLHHSQLLVYQQAFRPVPQENSLFVEQAEKPVKREWCKMCDRTHQLNVRPNSNKGGQDAHPTY